MSSTFLLNDSRNSHSMHCKVSPIVVMSILNHHQRRPTNRKLQKNTQTAQQKALYPNFVIGVLFGRKLRETNTLIVNDAFGLEAQLDPSNMNVAVNVDNAKRALELHAQSHPDDRFVGWYRTGLAIENDSSTIHELIVLKKLAAIGNKCCRKLSLHPSEYVHLLVDTALKNDHLSVKAYTMEAIDDPLLHNEYKQYLKASKERAALIKKNKKIKDFVAPPEVEPVEEPAAIFSRFVEIAVDYKASESEMIGLDMIIESPPDGQALDSPAMLMNDTNHLETVLQSLLQNIDDIEKYVKMVIEGKTTGDESLGWLIGDALSSVPMLSPQKFECMLSNRLQDFLMMVYLGKMTKTQLVIADKINKILPSTVPGMETKAKEPST